MKTRVRTIAAVISCFTFVGSVDAHRSAYRDAHFRIIDLGTLGGDESSAHGINEAGDAVGCAKTQAGDRHAFLYAQGKMVDLGTLPGQKVSVALAINVSGLIVGSSTVREDEDSNRVHKSSPSHAVIFKDGKVLALDHMGDFGNAVAVNSRGDIAGQADTREARISAFLFSGGRLRGLGYLPGGITSHVGGMNDAGTIVGDCQMDQGPSTAFIYRDGMMQVLDKSFPDFNFATAINNRNEVVGRYYRKGESAARMFLWSDGTYRDSGNLGDTWIIPTKINDNGQIVGTSGKRIDHKLSERAFIYEHGKLYDLNSRLPAKSGWKLTCACGINNRGQIAGVGLHNGIRRAFLMTPQ